MSYEDRGNKKWIPFLMPEHKGLLKRYYQEVHHLKFEDTEGPIDGTIENALNDAIFSGDIVTVTAINGPLTHRFDVFVENTSEIEFLYSKASRLLISNSEHTIFILISSEIVLCILSQL